MKKSLTKLEIIRKKASIDLLFASKESYKLPGMTLLLRRNSLGYNRIFFAPVKKLGNAVQRNRAKRLVKESYRHIKNKFFYGHDLACIIRPIADDAYSLRLQELADLGKLSKILKE